MFFLLSAFLPQSDFIRMDPYGFCMLGDHAGTHVPYLLALASIAGLAFHLIRQWQYSGDQGRSNALRRAVAVVLPPTLFAYATIVVISNIALWIQLVIVLPVLACVFMVLLVLRDPSVRPNARDRRLALRTTVALLAVMGTIGAAVVAALYLAPDTPSVLPDHNWWTSWEIDFKQLGYPEEEVLERLNRGYLWHGLATCFYLMAVDGGVLISSLHGIGKGGASSAAARKAGSGSRLYDSAAARVQRVASAMASGRRAGAVDAGRLWKTVMGPSRTLPLIPRMPRQKQGPS